MSVKRALSRNEVERLTVQERSLEREVLDDRERPQQLLEQARPSVGPLHRLLADVELEAHDSGLDGGEDGEQGDADEGGGTDLDDEQDRRCCRKEGLSVRAKMLQKCGETH